MVASIIHRRFSLIVSLDKTYLLHNIEWINSTMRIAFHSIHWGDVLCWYLSESNWCVIYFKQTHNTATFLRMTRKKINRRCDAQVVISSSKISYGTNTIVMVFIYSDRIWWHLISWNIYGNQRFARKKNMKTARFGALPMFERLGRFGN